MKQCIGLVTLLLLVFTNFLHPGTFNHAYLDSVFQLYIYDGLVDYEGIKVIPRLLNAYIRQISRVSKEDYECWTKLEKKAFWINVYNAYFLRIVSLNYPIKWGSIFAQARYPKNCIYQIKNFHKKPLNLRMAPKLNLKAVKHEILMTEFKDPRVLFALCDGTMRGPLLPKIAFKPSQLDEQLAQRVQLYLDNPENVKSDTLKNKLYLAYIFDENKQYFPKPEGQWDEEFKPETEPTDSPQVQQLKTAIAELKEKIARMRSQKFDEASLDSMDLAGFKYSPSTAMSQKDQSDTIKTSGKLKEDEGIMVNEYVRKIEDAPITKEISLLQQVSRDDSVGRAQLKILEKKKRKHEEAIKLEEGELKKLEKDLKQQIDFEFKSRKRNSLMCYDKKYHGVIYFLMHHLPTDRRDYLRDHHPAIKFFPKNVHLNEAKIPY